MKGLCTVVVAMGLTLAWGSTPIGAQQDQQLQALVQMLESECGRYRGSLDQRDHGRFYCAQAYQLECLNKTQELQVVCDRIRVMGLSCVHGP